MDLSEESFIELESIRELALYLPHGFEELVKYGTGFLDVML